MSSGNLRGQGTMLSCVIQGKCTCIRCVCIYLRRLDSDLRLEVKLHEFKHWKHEREQLHKCHHMLPESWSLVLILEGLVPSSEACCLPPTCHLISLVSPHLPSLPSPHHLSFSLSFGQEEMRWSEPSSGPDSISEPAMWPEACHLKVGMIVLVLLVCHGSFKDQTVSWMWNAPNTLQVPGSFSLSPAGFLPGLSASSCDCWEASVNLEMPFGKLLLDK